MFCSTIIPTVGRASLHRAVESVLGQALPADDFEIIVVNDSGEPLAKAAWQRSPRVQIIDTNRRERSLARNTGAAAARGRYLHFLDDDDWLAPNGLLALRDLAFDQGAAWLYGSTQLVDRQGRPLIQLQHELNGNCFLQVMAGEWIPLQASLIASHVFFAVSGFHPLLNGPEDSDLLRRVALRHDIAGTEAIVAHVVRGVAGSTTDYDAHPAQSRRAREQILEQPGVFTRLKATARGDAWHGRIARIYWTSSLWNLQRGRFWTACSRMVYGLAALPVAGRSLFSGRFWSAIARPYASETFARGFARAAQQVTAQPE